MSLPVTVAAGFFGLRFGYEHPSYEVIATHGEVEIRRYAPRLVAEVTVDAPDASAATRKGFRVLADYIFGANQAGAEVAMTTPVERSPSSEIAMTTPVEATGSDDRHVVRFTMPSKYTLDTIPTPTDPNVRLVRTPPTTFAAVRFGGRATETAIEQHVDQLRAFVEARGGDGGQLDVTVAQYDPPWTPGFLRRNEVMVEWTG